MKKKNKKPVMTELAGAGSVSNADPFGYFGEIQKSSDTILKAKGGELKIYEIVKRDDQFKSAFTQRVKSLVGYEWFVTPGGKSKADKMAADNLKEILDNISFDDKTEKMLWGLFYGYAVAEIIWATDGSAISIDQIKVRDRARFAFGKDGSLRLKANGKPDGVIMPDQKFWTWATGADHDDEPYGLGLAHWLYWPVFFKRGGMTSWLKFLDKFAQPTAIGKYPAGTTTADKDKLLMALSALGRDAAIALPDGMLVELLEAARAGKADYAGIYDRMNSAISKVILTQTLTTEQGARGSQALGNVHHSLLKSVIKSDADALCDSFNKTVATWLAGWNYPTAQAPKVWRRVEDTPTQAGLADTYTKIHTVGYAPTQTKIDETFGEGFEPVVKPVEPPPSKTLPASFAENALAGVSDLSAEDQDVLEEAAISFAEKYENIVGERLRSLVALLDETGDLASFNEGLAELLKADPPEEFVNMLENGGFNAQLLGRLRAEK